MKLIFKRLQYSLRTGLLALMTTAYLATILSDVALAQRRGGGGARAGGASVQRPSGGGRSAATSRGGSTTREGGSILGLTVQPSGRLARAAIAKPTATKTRAIA